jgi:hypothetical protein
MRGFTTRDTSAARLLAASAAAGCVALAAIGLAAAPQVVKINIYALADGTFDKDEFWALPSEPVTVTFANGDPFASHNIVFELDAGRQVASKVIGLGLSDKLTFVAPAILGDYPYYSSADDDRANGMTGTLHVGVQPSATPPPTTPVPGSPTSSRTPTVTRTPTGTRTPTNAGTPSAQASATGLESATATTTPTEAPPLHVYLPLALRLAAVPGGTGAPPETLRLGWRQLSPAQEDAVALVEPHG